MMTACFLLLFASMQSFAGDLTLKHQMRRAQLHKNVKLLEKIKKVVMAHAFFLCIAHNDVLKSACAFSQPPD